MVDIRVLEDQYLAKNIQAVPVVLSNGAGAYVYDNQGKRYLDMMSAVSVVSFGHSHPRLVNALIQQAQKIAVTSRLYECETLAPFIKRACELSGLDQGLPMNTGVEAVETALKAARRWGYQYKAIPENQAEVIACEHNFHGRTITAISMSTSLKYKKQFGPFTPGFKMIPFNDPTALEQAITPHTAAFLVEPIQGEAGIIVPDPGYLKECERICRANNVLLLCDEIQCGMGRSGTFLVSQAEQVRPDGVMLGKALGGGLLPVSLFLATHELMNVFQPGSHGSTFGGNPLASAVALEALNLLVEENLAEGAAQKGAYFLEQLHKINSPLIKEVRGRGLLIGIELHSERITAAVVCEKLLAAGLLAINTHDVTIRLLPSFIITTAQIDEGVQIIKTVLTALENQ